MCYEQFKFALVPLFQVVALDLRSYNLSDKPQGDKYYSIGHLVEDVQAVMRHLGEAISMGHDWGGGHRMAVRHTSAFLNMPALSSSICPGLTHELAQNSQAARRAPTHVTSSKRMRTSDSL